MFLLICKLYICIQNVFGHIFYSTRLHLYQQVWQFEVQKLAYMLILAAGGMIPYLSSVGGGTMGEQWLLKQFCLNHPVEHIQKPKLPKLYVRVETSTSYFIIHNQFVK